MRLRNKVRDARRALSMSQRELARVTGLSRQTISVIERDDGYEPNVSIMLRIAEALGADMGGLFWSEREVA